MADTKETKAAAAASASDQAMAASLVGGGAERRSRVGTARQAKAVKEERVPVREMSAEARQAMRDKAKVTSSGRGQPAVKGEAARLAAGVKASRRFTRQPRNTYKVIYFLKGVSPTVEEYEDSLQYQGAVFRNAGKIVLGAPLENCDAVAGAVPDDYAAVFPMASAGMKIDDENDEADLIARPARQFGGSNAPDDVRPGTVDDGIAHASGTGSSQPGMRNGDPTQPQTGVTPKSEAREMADAWKTGKTPGATDAAPSLNSA